MNQIDRPKDLEAQFTPFHLCQSVQIHRKGLGLYYPCDPTRIETSSTTVLAWMTWMLLLTNEQIDGSQAPKGCYCPFHLNQSVQIHRKGLGLYYPHDPTRIETSSTTSACLEKSNDDIIKNQIDGSKGLEAQFTPFHLHQSVQMHLKRLGLYYPYDPTRIGATTTR